MMDEKFLPPCIITRPHIDAIALIEPVRACGYAPIYAPLIEMQWLDAAIPDVDFQAILISSANSVRALCRDTRVARLFRLPVITVGPSSAAMARELGFRDVVYGAGNLVSLTQCVAERCDPDKGALFYPSGLTLSGDIKGMLEQKGFHVLHRPFYEARAVDTLPLPARQAIMIAEGSEDTGCVVLFSPRTARLWIDRLRDGDLIPAGRRLHHYVLADSIAGIILDYFPPPAPAITVAPAPNGDSLLSLLGKMRKRR